MATSTFQLCLYQCYHKIPLESKDSLALEYIMYLKHNVERRNEPEQNETTI